MPIKNLSLTKIWRVWLKNWVCHALLNFKIKMGVAGSIFELHPPNFVKMHIFWISTNDTKTIFCWLCWYRIWKKDDPVLRPGVKESMVNQKQPQEFEALVTNKQKTRLALYCRAYLKSLLNWDLCIKPKSTHKCLLDNQFIQVKGKNVKK